MGKTTISEDLTITGNLSGSAEIEIAGRIDGDVDGKSIYILESGSVSGAVKVELAQIRGQLAGSLSADTVEVQSGADIKASISAEVLEIQKGARLKGKLNISAPG